MAKKKSRKALQGTDNGVAVSLGGLSINESTSNAPKAKKRKPWKRDIVAEFASYFGNESKLSNWQRLCQDLGVTEDLHSVTQCKAAMKGIWVNIHDFIDAKAAGTQVRRFKTQGELAKYTIESGRIYPKKKAKKQGPIRALLAHIFG